MSILIIDYDDTYTANPDFWAKVIYDAKKNGFTVVCCTLRVGNEFVDADTIHDMKELDTPVVFAAEKHDKATAMIDAGYDISNAIWIDDSPEHIFRA